MSKRQTSDGPDLSALSDELLDCVVADLGIEDTCKRAQAKYFLSAHAKSFARGRYFQHHYPTVHEGAAAFRDIGAALKKVATKIEELNPTMSIALAVAWSQQNERSFTELQADLEKLQSLAERVGKSKFSKKQRDEVLRHSVGGLMLLLEMLTGHRATVRQRDSDRDLPPKLDSSEAKAIGKLLRAIEPELEDTTLVNVISKISREARGGPLDEFKHKLILGMPAISTSRK